MNVARAKSARSWSLCGLLITSLVLASSALAGEQDPAWPEIPPEAWLEKPRPDSGGADAIVLEEVAEVRHGEDFEIEYSHFTRIKIFTDAGHRQAKFERTFANTQFEIKNVRARSIRPDGTVTTLSADQIMETTIIKLRGLDVRQMSFVVPGVEPGSIVDIAYDLSDLRGSWTEYFENPIYTLRSELRWYPAAEAIEQGLKPVWFSYGPRASLLGVKCVPSCSDATEILIRGCCISGFIEEQVAPPRARAESRYVLGYRLDASSYLRYWTMLRQFVRMACEKYEDKMKPLEELASESLEQNENPDAALVSTYRWFQENIRCIDELSWAQEQKYGPDLEANTFGKRVSIGELLGVKGYLNRAFGGARIFKDKEAKPSAGRLFERKWGTEFEINLAFALVAEELGFTSCVAFVEDQRLTSFEPELRGFPPSHSLVAIRGPGDSWVFYQPASSFTSLASVPWWYRGERVLLVGEDRAMVTRIGSNYGAPGACNWSLAVDLDVTGAAKGTVAARLEGELGREYKSWLWERDPSTWPDELQKRLVHADVPVLDIDLPKIPKQADSALVLRGQIVWHKGALVAGKAMALAPSELIPWRYKVEFDSDVRLSPILLKYPRNEVVECDLALPAGSVLDRVPERKEFRNELGTWTISWEKIPSGIRYTRTVVTDEAYVEPEHYGVVLEFFEALEDADRQTISVALP